MKSRFSGIEESLTFINEKFEENKTELKELKDSVKQIDSATKSLSSKEQDLQDQLVNLICDHNDLKERHRDLQWRNMRDNFIINGIPEVPEENTENVVIEFLSRQMKIVLDPSKFHRVHRFGRTGTGRPRPIVAKFVFYKDKEGIQKSQKKLKDTPYGISDMYPREINQRRKELYPHYKQARQQGMKVVMNGDKLYINNKLFDPREHVNNNHMDTDHTTGRNHGVSNRGRRMNSQRLDSRGGSTLTILM
ncbi:uncharacterized protein LOC130052570 [Ostrea edulis]|uniref:uncharacterized protein LOC130052570 n=1 Tax=Ostrea edulis TaxID=37623 RepID=UPI0024AEE9C3|nr:uncharacterized protein LOC130052570 [Ostrea edulis]